MKKFLALLAALCVTSTAGCYLNRPNWCSPGTAGQQQNDARFYDPFPDPDIAPEIEGGRPMGFQEPRTDINPERRPPQWRDGRWISG